MNMANPYIVLIPLILELVVLLFAVFADAHLRRSHRIIMIIIILCAFGLVAQNYADFLLSTRYIDPYARTVVGIAGYVLRPLILILFFYIVDDRRFYNYEWVLIALNTAIQITALFSPIAFSIGSANNFIRGPLGYSCHIISGILLIKLLYLSLRGYGRVRRIDLFIPIANAVLVIAAVAADTFVDIGDSPIAFLTIAVVTSCVFYYIWLHLQFVREHEIEMETEQRIQIMMSQIQPHFLFNTLSTIQALCRIDPAKASDTVEKFGTYLRQNLDSLDQTDLIPFSKELEHVQLYADIEMIRFPSIKVEFRIEDDDFKLPTLSVQPLVENAIRHGVRIRENGLVSVRSWRDLGEHVITISDNGAGFDVTKLGTAEGTHIGIKNVKERIEKMCGGTMEIVSTIGDGTSVTIRIPADRG
ncbi:MAG: histidine kinase [Firmicutes bacterium]|nr:histidine kinase [Bacillota bacterium]